MFSEIKNIKKTSKILANMNFLTVKMTCGKNNIMSSMSSDTLGVVFQQHIIPTKLSDVGVYKSCITFSFKSFQQERSNFPCVEIIYNYYF